jgi:hypothetical protein
MIQLLDLATTVLTRRFLEEGVVFGEPFSEVMVLLMTVVVVLLHL